MHTLNKNIYVLAMCLSALAGYVDAIGFLQLGGYFISFMSGNSTRLAVHLADAHLFAIALLGGIILLFVSGAMLGALVSRLTHPHSIRSVLLCVTALLSSAAASYTLGWDYAAIALMILAMGMENAVFLRNGEVVVGLTYMTGALVKVGHRLADAALGGPRFAWFPYLLLWAGLVAGGIVGALTFERIGLQSLWLAALWAGGLAAAAFCMKHRWAV